MSMNHMRHRISSIFRKRHKSYLCVKSKTLYFSSYLEIQVCCSRLNHVSDVPSSVSTNPKYLKHVDTELFNSTSNVVLVI